MADIERQMAAQDVSSRAAHYRERSKDFAHWAAGYGVIEHNEATQVRIYALAEQLFQQGTVPHVEFVFRLLAAADRVTSAANSLSGITRSWLMGQGHCVSAIDAANLLVGNMSPAHARRYDHTSEGLTRFVSDFYSYAVLPDGTPESPLGSHVSAHTAGGMMEGGYLGFAELQYMHMPLPGEHLVTFLSDGAFEEQRGSDWTPRWWRADDCGLITPFMIMNGRRIDQRSSVAMKGGVSWLDEHLRLNGFVPVHINGRDPADFAWGIIEMETRLNEAADAIRKGEAVYPAPIFYGIAETEKGFGFPGAGSNRAHNLPLQGNPAEQEAAQAEFNAGAHKLWVQADVLHDAVRMLNQHAAQERPKERDHPLADRQIPTPELPEPPWKDPGGNESASAMGAIDNYFCDVVEANPGLRARVGNPDEMLSNGLERTLNLLKHRVVSPEPGMPEAIHGGVITALNEEAVVNAALANKGGINLVASYEAFAVKMLGAIRQELIFARQLYENGRPPGWLAVPVIPTSHAWENGKNERSHQDTTFCEALLSEPGDVSRVLFPADWNSALAALQACYSAHGQIWTLVTSKRPLPVQFTAEQARQLIEQGAIRLRSFGRRDERLQLIATGGYQLVEVMKASTRLAAAGIDHGVIYLQEPGRFRTPRDEQEMSHMAPAEVSEQLFPKLTPARVFVTHTRPAPFVGTIWPLLTDAVTTPVLGYIGRGGTLNENGMLFANRCTWAHVVAAATVALGESADTLLNVAEYAALLSEARPAAIFEPDLEHVE